MSNTRKNSTAISKNITIYKQVIKPNERTTILLPMPKLYDWTPMKMPVHVINGKKSGPVLCVTAAIHGDEVNGVEIARRLLKKPVLKNIKGTLIIVPIVNVYGFLYLDRYLMDRRDLNRSFPGSRRGSLAARLARLVTEELLMKSTHNIDLHAGSLHRTNLPQIRANLNSDEVVRLAKSFNAPVMLHAALRDGSMRQYANDLGIPCLLYEAGESLRFDEPSIRIGLAGILSVMQTLKMLKKFKKQKPKKTPTIARASYWVRATHSGILRPYTTLGKKIKKGDVLAVIANPTSSEEHKLLSPLTGVVIGQSNLPLGGCPVFR